MAISLDPELARQIRRSAGKRPISAWLADAAARKLRAEGLLRVVEDFEAEHGTITEDEMAAVKRTWQQRGHRRR